MPLRVVIKYWLYSSCCTILVAYFMLSSLYLLITFPFIALIPLLFLLLAPTLNSGFPKVWATSHLYLSLRCWIKLQALGHNARQTE